MWSLFLAIWYDSYCMATKKDLTALIKQIAKQLSGNVEPKDGDLVPHHCIKGAGYGYYHNYTDRSFVKIAKGTEVFLLAENFDYLGRSLVYSITHEILLIEPDELEYIGFN